MNTPNSTVIGINQQTDTRGADVVHEEGHPSQVVPISHEMSSSPRVERDERGTHGLADEAHGRPEVVNNTRGSARSSHRHVNATTHRDEPVNNVQSSSLSNDNLLAADPTAEVGDRGSPFRRGGRGGSHSQNRSNAGRRIANRVDRHMSAIGRQLLDEKAKEAGSRDVAREKAMEAKEDSKTDKKEEKPSSIRQQLLTEFPHIQWVETLSYSQYWSRRQARNRLTVNGEQPLQLHTDHWLRSQPFRNAVFLVSAGFISIQWYFVAGVLIIVYYIILWSLGRGVAPDVLAVHKIRRLDQTYRLRTQDDHRSDSLSLTAIKYMDPYLYDYEYSIEYYVKQSLENPVESYGELLWKATILMPVSQELVSHLRSQNLVGVHENESHSIERLKRAAENMHSINLSRYDELSLGEIRRNSVIVAVACYRHYRQQTVDVPFPVPLDDAVEELSPTATDLPKSH